MLRLLVRLLSVLVYSVTASWDPVADPRATVVADNVRITVLTDRLFRIEQRSVDFVDCPTLAVVNRRLPVPDFAVEHKNGTLSVKTAYVTLSYQIGANFTPSTLSASGLLERDRQWHWRYGDVDGGNLLGTIRTLDLIMTTDLNCSTQPVDAHCEYGLISRSGYAIVDDTDNWCLDDSWWDGPNPNQHDLYLFGHGHDYRAALAEYRLIGGAIPLLPRYALGVWYSRWYDYNVDDLRDMVRAYEQRSLPLDVMVIDMNWHTKNDWTGYSWDRRLYPMAQPLGYLRSRDLAVTLNLHDADGVGPWEEQYEALCRVLGTDAEDQQPINFTIVNRTVMEAIDDVVLGPLQEQGVDFWWIDWQQGEEGPGGAVGGKMNPTIWTAHVRSTNAARHCGNRRDMVLARWGGLGAHRYPVHFSGDVARLTWETLPFQVYFSITAVNVGAIWSHDFAGPGNDPELYARFLQWSTFSGISRAHERGYSAGDCVFTHNCTIVEPWRVPTTHAEANYAALRLRGRLLPYTYTAAFQAHVTGLQFTVPLYYEWPELEMAYETGSVKPSFKSNLDSQFLFGDDLMVAPVVRQSQTDDQLARMHLWVPPGTWVGIDGGATVNGNKDGSTVLQVAADIAEIVVYARAGAVIPMRPIRPGATIGLANKPYAELEWHIFLSRTGPSHGLGQVHEDDGRTTAYLDGDYATTSAAYQVTDNDTQTTVSVTISTEGHKCCNVPSSRVYRVHLINTLPPAAVYLKNGVSIPWSQFGGPNTWSYDANNAAVIVELTPSPVRDGTEFNLLLDQREDVHAALEGIGFQIARARAAKATLDEIRMSPGSQTGEATSGGALLRAASLGAALEVWAGESSTKFDAAVLGMASLLTAARQEVANMRHQAIPATTLRLLQPEPGLLVDPEISKRVTRALALLNTASPL